MGTLIPVASVLETWLACDVQVVLLQDCGLVESLTLLVLAVDEAKSETAGEDKVLTALEVQVEFGQGCD